MMSLKRTALAAGLALAATTQAYAAAQLEKVSFYFAAHEDDWQLFMNPSAFEDVAGGASKTVFVHVTAGDAGNGIGNGGRHWPYYRARENGAEDAIKFMADTDRAPGTPVEGNVTIGDHSVYRVAYGKTVSYFLRVADGNPSGAGYAATGWQSLRRLHDGENNVLAAVDGSTVYRGWGDLVQTVRALVQREADGKRVQINVAETDTRVNPGDHSDHLMVAQAALDAVKDVLCVRRVFYVDYASAKLPQNLNAPQRDMESSVFAVTLAGVQALDHTTYWRHYDHAYVGRNYFRTQEPPAACGTPTAKLSTTHR
jgi:hypothetical protein